MSAEVKKEIQLEIAHVLFTDIVGYSKVVINEQRALLDTLNQIVRGTDEPATISTNAQTCQAMLGRAPASIRV